MNKRFVWTVGAIREQFPDIPLEATESTLLWDRQEGRAVVSVYSCYANAFCLEHKEHGQPFTHLEEWFNGLSNEALISEGIEPTKPAKPDFTEAANAFYDMVTEHLAKLDPRYQSTFSEQQIKVWNYFAQAIGPQNTPTIHKGTGQQNASEGKLERKDLRQTAKKTIWAVHEDTDEGQRLRLFTSGEAEAGYCAGLMRARGGEKTIFLLNSGDHCEAWAAFKEEQAERQNYYARHEEEI